MGVFRVFSGCGILGLFWAFLGVFGVNWDFMLYYWEIWGIFWVILGYFGVFWLCFGGYVVLLRIFDFGGFEMLGFEVSFCFLCLGFVFGFRFGFVFLDLGLV